MFAGRDPGARAAGDLVEAEAEILGQSGGEDVVLGAVSYDHRGEDGDVALGGGLGESEENGELAGKAEGEGGGEEGGDGENRDGETDDGRAAGRVRSPGSGPRP